MGLISLLFSLLIILFGGYYFFGMRTSTFSVSNDSETPPSEISLDQLEQKANDVKNTVEEKAKDSLAQIDDAVKQKVNKEEKPPAAPAPSKDSLAITDRLMSTGFAVPRSQRKIDTIVIHSSYNPLGGDPYSVSTIVKTYESYGVSAHYIIDRDGKIYRLVEDKNIAYHAGVSKMPDGRTDVNNFSIGIEMINKMDTQFTDAEYAAVNGLIASLKKKYPIKDVVGHSDIAPGRKTDPWNFDWKKLK